MYVELACMYIQQLGSLDVFGIFSSGKGCRGEIEMA